MSDLEVRIVKLEPMHVASVRAISGSPERDAWEKLRAWAEPKGLLDNVEKHPVFGFNNPNPSSDRKEYGYEFWIRIDPDTEPGGEIEAKDFAGGLYAVTTCKLLGDPKGNVPEVWMKLWEWVQASRYKWRKTHELEKAHNPIVPEEDLVLDLYLPIEE
jgi:DNA gyrase inhibitor GyrI